MGWSKRDYVVGAFEEIGLGSYSFDIPPEQEQMALRRLDAMIAEWAARGIHIGWPISSDPIGADPEQQTETSDLARQAIVSNLALRIAGPFGKSPPDFVRTTAHRSLANLVRAAVRTPEMQMPGTFPLGAGNDFAFTEDPIQSGDVEEPVPYDDL